MWEKLLMKLMPKLKETLLFYSKNIGEMSADIEKLKTDNATLKKRLDAEMVARKNEVNRVEKEVNKDWVGDEIENDEKERMIKTLESDDIVDTDTLP